MKSRTKPIIAAVLLCAALCFVQQRVTAQQPVYSLVVYTANDGRTAFVFDDRPEMTIEGSMFRVSSAMTDVEFSATDILRFTIEDGTGQPAYDNFWLVVHTKDGHSDGYAFKDYPEVSIRSNLFYVYAAGQTLAYPAENVESFTIEDHYDGDPTPHGGVATPVERPRAGTPAADGDARPQWSLTPGTVSLSGLAPGTAVHVYDSGGRLAQSAIADSGGSLSFSLEPLRPGVYIVRTDSTSFKVIRK